MASASYPHLSWDHIVARARTSKEFALEFQDCRLTFPGKKAKTFIPAKMDDVTEIHGRCERSLWFLTEAEFQERFKVKLASCEHVCAEQGHLMRGVFWLVGERMLAYASALKSVPSASRLAELIEKAKQREEMQAEEKKKQAMEEARAPLQQLVPQPSEGPRIAMEVEEPDPENSQSPLVVSKITESFTSKFHADGSVGTPLQRSVAGLIPS